MLRHVVLYKFYGSTTENQKSEAETELRTLGHKIANVRNWSVGRDVGRNPGRNHDLAQVCEFDDHETLLKFRAHPEHIRVRDILCNIADWVVVDYEL